MDIQTLIREFRYNSVVLADPNPTLTLHQVRDFFANVYPEITSADIEGPVQTGAKEVYTFRRAVGTKGASLTREVALQRLRSGGRLVLAQRPVHVLALEQVNQPVVKQLDTIVNQHRHAAGPRCLAPSANHSVLP